MTVQKRCTKCGEHKSPADFGKDASAADGKRVYCRVCDRAGSRGRVRARTADRMLRSRAINRAMARLRDLHRAEYERLYVQELAAAQLEAAGHAATAPAPPVPTHAGAHEAPVPLLKPGPRQIDEVGPRLREDVGRCPLCINRHDRDHRCPSCGSKPQVAGPVVPVTRRRVRVDDVVA